MRHRRRESVVQIVGERSAVRFPERVLTGAAGTAGTAATARGGVAITGRVVNDITGRPGLPGWTVEVTGPSAAAVVTDGAGSYTFAGLPPGTYLVCEVLQAGWRQTVPSTSNICPTGVGYRLTLAEGNSASFVNFGNVAQD